MKKSHVVGLLQPVSSKRLPSGLGIWNLAFQMMDLRSSETQMLVTKPWVNMPFPLQSLPSRQLHPRPRLPQNGVMVGRAGRRPGVFGVVHVDHTLRPLRRMTRLIGGMFTRSTFPNQSGSLAKEISDLASPTAPNIPDLRLARAPGTSAADHFPGIRKMVFTFFPTPCLA